LAKCLIGNSLLLIPVLTIAEPLALIQMKSFLTFISVLTTAFLLGQERPPYKLDSLKFMTVTSDSLSLEHYEQHARPNDTFIYFIRHYFSIHETADQKESITKPLTKTLIVDKNLIIGQFLSSQPTGTWYLFDEQPCYYPYDCKSYLPIYTVKYNNEYIKVNYLESAELTFSVETSTINGRIKPTDLPSADITCESGECEYYPIDGSETLYGHVNFLEDILKTLEERIKIRTRANKK
jgi:hypothetical protein